MNVLIQADNLLLLKIAKIGLQDLIYRWREALEEYNLKINLAKIKIIRNSRTFQN